MDSTACTVFGLHAGVQTSVILTRGSDVGASENFGPIIELMETWHGSSFSIVSVYFLSFLKGNNLGMNHSVLVRVGDKYHSWAGGINRE
jgi:hypothetical protein